MSGRKWIPLPVEFKGIWYSPSFGGFNVYLRDRFDPRYPPDRLNERLRRLHPELAREDHNCAEPTWVSKEEFEEEFGKVEAVLVNEEAWNSDDLFTPDENDLLIFTDRYVVTLDEYDGYESFRALPRDWRGLLEGREGRAVPEEEREGAVSGEAWRRQILGYSTTTSPSDWITSTTAWEMVADSTATAYTRRTVVAFTATTAWPDP